MFKNTLSLAAATIAVVASTSLPAAAVGGLPAPVSVPEPTTILGTLVVGGIGLLTTKKNAAVSNKEQK
ncbi:PEP-CTERM sorting domain-containing protein [Okeania sp.]|uniref:PEP-CTERM sorting domain-containing protein n=1 Tax=Okeania sp. TaxID=3100323 RepID=UPI002B4AD565|nr:PEP-CTERM sorting domain-containing protein [Okeania sp.]MEB3343476.1 PEP-CTERM sorting domain-containing protein [Okeania sp.]